MSNRREFIVRAASAALTTTAFTSAGRAAVAASGTVKGLVRREDTIMRLGGAGDGYHMTWSADDRQLTAVCDGFGWFKNPKGLYNSRLWAIGGGPHAASIADVPGYPELLSNFLTQEQQRYYGFGTLSLEGCIYQFLSFENAQALRPDGSDTPDLRWQGAKLIYSPDDGRTWCNQDGSAPVVWEPFEARSHRNMVFYKEPQSAFSLLSVLQMGRNYEHNRDGYVYVYAPNGAVEGTLNQLVMFRVPKQHIRKRSAYEYFERLLPDGRARWVKDIEARGIVHTFPSGWVGKGQFSWQPSVTYNAPLGLYMMANWGWGFPDEALADKPSYLGFWIAHTPWGPWTQVHEETAWCPGNDPAARAYSPQIAPKWIAADGRSFWLVWSDYQGAAEFNLGVSQLADEARRHGASRFSQDQWNRTLALMRAKLRYYSFNAQRVDFVFA